MYIFVTVCSEKCLVLCIFTGETCVTLMTEADSTDITEHPHDDKSRPYVCTVCDKRFTQKGHMTGHRKR